LAALGAGLMAGLAFGPMSRATAPPEKSPFVPADSPYAGSIANLRRLSDEKKRLDVAEQEGRRLMAAVEAALGRDAPEIIEIRSVLVHVLMERGKKRVPE